MKLTNKLYWTDGLILFMLYSFGLIFIQIHGFVGTIAGVILKTIAIVMSIRVLYILCKKLFVKL